MRLKYKELIYRPVACASLVGAGLLCSAITVFSQEAATPPTEKWRPKDGVYASPGKDFESDCNEAHFIVIELAEKSVSGNEWSCKINKRTTTAVNAIRLDMTCYDYNLAESLYPKDPKAGDREIKEVMLLKRLDNDAISIRKTVNNKFTDSSWRADYCAEQVQRTHVERNAEAKLQTAEEKMRLNPWRPKVGVYAASGTNFSERCLNGGEAIIDLSERSVTSGADKCSIIQIRDELSTVQMFVECNTPPRPETIILRKLDDATATVLLQKTRNRNFSDPGEQLSYCGPATQAMYARRKSKK